MTLSMGDQERATRFLKRIIVIRDALVEQLILVV